MPRGNIENLKTFSSEEARRNGKKGGIKSGEARRRKKAMKERLEVLLSMPLDKGNAKDIEKIKNFAALQGQNITVEDAVLIAQIQMALTGNVKAAAFIRDTIGEKPSADDWSGYNEDEFQED